MGIIVILVSMLVGFVETGALCMAVWLLCEVIGIAFNPVVTVAAVGVLNLFVMMKLLKEDEHDDK